MLRNTDHGWGVVSRALHWGLAILIIGMLAYGWWMNHVAARPERFYHRSIHADIGYLVLLLMVLRLIWRGVNPVPVAPPGMPLWQRWAARASHVALYLLTIVVALFGWAHSGAHTPNYADWFGLFKVPQFTSPDKAAADQFEDLHIYGAYVLMGLVALHFIAALYHQFVADDDVNARMLKGTPD